MNKPGTDIIAVTARCNQCNEFLFYDGRKNLFSPYLRCNCGGNIDAMVGTVKLAGTHPFYPEKTFSSEQYEGSYFYAYKNRNGECFVYHNNKLHKIENPILQSKSICYDKKSNG